ncbi:MAG: peptide chain release factor N(5)-glutamine methyltransferase [Sphingobacteriales bacterium]|nr:peptide chain release factor N(5)-glutamine methyltransferase [Sphingobacteriales bacterium]MCC7222750.1 peptide chain release factor N(5)-glutamine methyltransferase [Chitinophagales bacterium]
MTLRNALSYFRRQLEGLYDPNEAKNIAEIALQHIADCSRLHLLMHGEQVLSDAQVATMHDFLDALLQYCPLQHLTGETIFCGLHIACSSDALIPRPETEELVAWAIDTCRDERMAAPRIADIGTGTGCIALALRRYIPQAHIIGIDLSPKALHLAQRNAQNLNLAVEWRQLDILQPHADAWLDLPPFDIWVSNPPYILQREIAELPPQVADYEPHLALAVPDDDPCLFYKAIARAARQCLNPRGFLLVETHELYADTTAQAIANLGFDDMVIRHDINGKARMVRARRGE